MRRVRLVDLPAVGWTLSNAFTPSRATARAAWPLWSAIALFQPGFVHAGGKVVLCLTRSAGARTRWLGRLVLVTLGIAGGGVLAQVALRVTTGASVNVTAILALSLAAAVLPGVVITARQPGVRARLGGRQATGDAQWSIDMLAARPGTAGLATATAYVAGVVPSGDSIATHAATERHVRAYRRYGFQRADDRDPLLLVRPGTATASTSVVGTFA